jgi:hypothetical protein
MLQRVEWVTLVMSLAVGCASDGQDIAERVGGVGSHTDPIGADASGATGEPDGSLCAKYGGAARVRDIIGGQVLGRIASDCRVHAFFAGLTPAGMIRVSDCLSIQVAELMGCSGVHYAGAFASNGLECRDMRTSHIGLGISAADFDAFLEDVVAGLDAAGMERADIEAAAPALLALKATIVEAPAASVTRTACEPTADDGASDGGALP